MTDTPPQHVAPARALRLAIDDLMEDLEDICRAATLHARQHPELQQAADLLNATHDSLSDADDELFKHARIKVSSRVPRSEFISTAVAACTHEQHNIDGYCLDCQQQIDPDDLF